MARGRKTLQHITGRSTWAIVNMRSVAHICSANCLPRPPGAGVGSQTLAEPMDGHGVGNVPRTSARFGHHTVASIFVPLHRRPLSSTAEIPLMILPAGVYSIGCGPHLSGEITSTHTDPHCEGSVNHSTLKYMGHCQHAAHGSHLFGELLARPSGAALAHHSLRL